MAVENNVHLSHNQYMVTYDGARNNDIVGVFDPWFPTQDTTSGTFSYSLVDNEGGIYAINNSTGTIIINDNSKLVSGTDTLKVQVTLQSRTEYDYVYIKVKSESDCYFIDPSSNQNGIGTRNSPYNTWSGIKFFTGKAYFQKRGTITNDKININKDGIPGNEIIIGAYGNGNRPQFTTGTDIHNGAINITASYIQLYEL